MLSKINDYCREINKSENNPVCPAGFMRVKLF